MSTETQKPKKKGGRKLSDSEIPVLRCPNFQKTYSTRVLVTRTEYDFRALFANEKMSSDSGEEIFIGESLAILTPLAAKELNGQLSELLKGWEKEHGPIKRRSSESIYSEQSLSP